MKHGLFQAKSLKNRKVISKLKKNYRPLKKTQQTTMFNTTKNVQKYKAIQSHLLPWRYREIMKEKCSDSASFRWFG